MQRRRELLVQNKSRLPPAYQEVEWVKGSECDIDLQYVPVIKPKAKTRMAFNSGNGDRDEMGFPNNTEPSFIINCYVRGNNADTTWYNRYGRTSSYSMVYKLEYDEPNNFEFGEEVVINGTVVKTASETTWSDNLQSFHLFAARTRSYALTVYSFELWDGDSQIRKLIPCYRKADDVIGMYDLISNSFFTSATGTFTKGPNV